MVCVVLIPCFALLLGYAQKAVAMRSHYVCYFVTLLLDVFLELVGGFMFFLTLVKHSCVVSVNSVSDAFSTNQKIDLFVTFVTLDVR